jgi:hypothetical protein
LHAVASRNFFPLCYFSGREYACYGKQGLDLSMERFFGGSPAAVILRLAIISVIIGVILSFFGFDLDNLYVAILRLWDWISSLGWGAVKRIMHYLVLGAIVVVPLWLLSRVFTVFGSGRQKQG